MQYVQIIEFFIRFLRSIRSSDFELYFDAIYEITNMFFIFNQPNYARWSLSYVSELLNMKFSNSDFLLNINGKRDMRKIQFLKDFKLDQQLINSTDRSNVLRFWIFHQIASKNSRKTNTVVNRHCSRWKEMYLADCSGSRSKNKLT